MCFHLLGILSVQQNPLQYKYVPKLIIFGPVITKAMFSVNPNINLLFMYYSLYLNTDAFFMYKHLHALHEHKTL